MPVQHTPKIKASEITPQAVFENRRKIIKASLGFTAAALLPKSSAAQNRIYQSIPTGPYSGNFPVTDFEDVSHYTNYYEFTTNKTDATVLAQALKIKPWQVEISGEVEKPGIYNLEDILKQNPLEERIYRFRCVEAWSMVVPWIGFPLAGLLKRFQPTSKAKFVEFTTVYQPENMPGLKKSSLNWPYTEGLRIDEAMHPLTLLATGMYDQQLPKQNGAPLRLVAPWKYGFKSIKAIVRIHLRETQPETAWHQAAPNEYGFYANVNPHVPHPRWSQARERVLGAGLFSSKRNTELFNGYGEQVAHLYKGMDLSRFI